MIKKVGTKINIAIVVCCLFMIAILAVVMLINVNFYLKTDMHNLVTSITESNKNLIEQRIVKVMDITNDITTIVESIVDPEQLPTKAQEYEDIIDPIVKEIIGDNLKDVMGVYLILNPEKTDKVYGSYYGDINVDGNLVKREKTSKEYFYKENERLSWYYDCIDLKEGKWFEPYVSSSTKIEMTSFTRPIYKDNVYIGMLSVDINFKLFKDYVNSISLINSGYVFVLNEKYNFIMHNKLNYESSLSDVEDKKYQYIVDKIEANDKTISDFDLDGTEKFLGYDKLSNNWIVCAVIGKDTLVESNNKLIKLIVSVMIIGIVVSFIIAGILGKRISSVITYVTKSLNILSKLDLTVSSSDKIYEEKHSKKDQLGTMISSTSNLRKHLRKIIPEIQDNSKTTLEYSNNLDSSIEQSSQSMNGITGIMNQLTVGSQEQTQNAKEGVSKLSSLAEMIESSISFANDVKSHLDTTQDANKINMEHMQNLSDKFEINKESSKQVSDNIKLLSEKTKNIQAIVVTIQSIAKRTNLLSLNASIEAAAAGEHGRGFTIVAKEIGKLAEQTSTGTAEIKSIVDEISDNMLITENSMSIGEIALSEATSAMGESIQSLDIIDKDIDTMAEVSNDLLDTIENINKNKEDVIEAINSILSVSEETAISIQGAMETLQEESINISGLASTSGNLRDISNVLDSIVNSFKI